MPLNLKPHCVENLKKLRNFLWDNREKIKVNMKWYGDLPLENYERPVETLAECGSVGCAIGWAPKVVPVREEYLYGPAPSVHYGLYAHQEFCSVGDESHFNQDTVFRALFSYRWADDNKDPTTLGVVFRIDTVLELNDIPDEFDPDGFDDETENKKALDAYHTRRNEWLKNMEIQ